RFQGTPEDHGSNLSFELSGFNFAGYKVGLQWSPIEELEVGVVYRSETETLIEGGDSRLFGLLEYDRAETQFTLPDKVGLGVRGSIAPVSLALDVEYTFNSKVQTQTFSFFNDPAPGAEPADGPVEPAFELVNFARWRDNVTLRLGAEYCLSLEPMGLDHQIKPRIGYVYDGQVGNKAFPTAFGTPPTATQTITMGAGYDGGPWEINLAYAYRYGSVTIDKTDLPHSSQSNTDSCLACGKPGRYEISLHGIYLDFSWDF
ncbi:MAG: hypothetical protein QF464_16315, partial [Myxococcota bacterium]|nr:hypothetical protein [Myxococcota bacterium]